jgi:hypothetical protein
VLFGKKAGTAVGARCRCWCGYRVGGEKIMRDTARAEENGAVLSCVLACGGMQNGLPSSSCNYKHKPGGIQFSSRRAFLSRLSCDGVSQRLLSFEKNGIKSFSKSP